MLVRGHLEVVLVVDPVLPLLCEDLEPVRSAFGPADGFRDLFPDQALTAECYNLPLFEVRETRSSRHHGVVMALQTFRAGCRMVPVVCSVRIIPFGSLAVSFSRHYFVRNPMYKFKFRGRKSRLFGIFTIALKRLEI